MAQEENTAGNTNNSKERIRFDVKALDRYEFVDYIIEYLKNNIGVTIESLNYSNHLAFYKGSICVKSKQLPAAIIGYGGSGTDLRDLPTPLQTELLPLVFEYWNKISSGNSSVPLLILGHSFDEVFLRKIRLLKIAISDIRLIQFINVYRFESIQERFRRIEEHLTKVVKINNEVMDFQTAMVEYLKSGGELGGYSYDVLDCEVPAGEGTKKSEVIDILALERKRKWLTVIELKYEKLLNARLKSVIFQSLDYCNWVEDHKRGLAMFFPEHKIDVRRRTRLILINGPEKFPESHKEFAKACNLHDRYQEVELYFTNDHIPLVLNQFVKTLKRPGKG
ncbi:MAG: hypothetical protein KKC39_08020 [Candidatus Omnitrophica bacterium]|nr:hypothetical protein [Candidatus Omnitrophota bacterium]MBU4468664.1 hypothetical protein [Candidatus Omnitrophota bacterium]MCG2707553.1 hypothetical protein [Candidatus Omnitrophota bacterium]